MHGRARWPAGPQHISEVGRLGYGNQWRLPLQGESGAELARVLGGGVVPGSLTLVGGDPGDCHRHSLLPRMCAGMCTMVQGQEHTSARLAGGGKRLLTGTHHKWW